MIDRLKGVVLVFVVWLVAVLAELREAIHEARHPKKKRQKFDPNHIPIILPPEMGPLVETMGSDHPMPLVQIPIRSTKADAKREAWKFAEHRVGHELTWKQARRLLNGWEREERARNRALAPEYAERMNELSEATG